MRLKEQTIQATRKTRRSCAASALEAAYRKGQQVRIENISQQQAGELYSRTLRFITHFVNEGRLLDVGCGSGWLAYLLAQHGFEVDGIDLNEDCFEVPDLPTLALRSGSATDIPCAAESFDIVIANTVLEHIVDPGRVLREMARVLKPGGLLIVTGPNLVALGPSIKGLLQVWQHRPRHEIFFRTQTMPRFPFGSTLPEKLAILVRNLIRIPQKLMSRSYRFEFREPDLQPPFHSDNDAIFLCNPADIGCFLVSEGFEILQDVDLGRGQWTKMLAGGTWVAARKVRTS